MTTTTTDRVWVACGRCGGDGHYGGNVLGGKCFACLDGNGRPTGGTWVTAAVAKRRKADAKRRKAAREAKEAARLAAFEVVNDAAIDALVAVGFTNVRELAAGSDARAAYAAQDALFAVRDYGADPAEAYADWQAATAKAGITN